MRSLAMLAFATACGGPSSTPDVPGDAPGDAPPDATPDLCKHRTSPAGIPEGDYPTSAILPNSLTIRSQLDVDLLAGIRMIKGDLDLAADLTSITLPDLEVIEGNLSAFPPTVKLTELRMPRLETVGGRVMVAASATGQALEVLDLGQLESVGQGLYIGAGLLDMSCVTTNLGVQLFGATTDLVLPHLVTRFVDIEGTQSARISMPLVTGEIQLINNAALVELQLGSPTSVFVSNSPALASVTATSISQLSFVTLADVGLDSLAFLAGAPLAGAQLQDLPALHDLSPIAGAALTSALALVRTRVSEVNMPNIVGLNSIAIIGNPLLATLDLPNLTTVSPQEQFITDNPTLPTCQAVALMNRIPGLWIISGNGSGACP